MTVLQFDNSNFKKDTTKIFINTSKDKENTACA